MLTAAAKAAADRPVYLPCRITRVAGRLDVAPLPWTGSSDLVGLAVADGLVALAAGGPADPGTAVEVLEFSAGATGGRHP